MPPCSAPLGVNGLSSHLLLYGGLDFILDREGLWHFVEANDHPVSLSLADNLANSQIGSIFTGQAVSTLAKELVDLSDGKPVVLLLPDCFSIDTHHNKSQMVRFRSPVDDHGRSHCTVTDFNELAEAVRALDRACFIVDKDRICVNGNKLLFRDNLEIGVLYRRSYRFPQQTTDTPCVNDLRLRSICMDKLATAKLIDQYVPEANCIPTYSLEDADALHNFLKIAVKDQTYVITKPRTGSGSRDIQRIQPSTLPTLIDKKNYRPDLVYQPWIPPIKVDKNGFSYCADVRVFLVSGKPVAGFARQAAAPIEGVASDSALAWLTTTGPQLPLCYVGDRQESPALCLTEQQSDALFSMSKKIISVLERRAAETNYQTVCSELADFSTQLGIDGAFFPVSLESA